MRQAFFGNDWQVLGGTLHPDREREWLGYLLAVTTIKTHTWYGFPFFRVYQLVRFVCIQIKVLTEGALPLEASPGVDAQCVVLLLSTTGLRWALLGVN